jgi:fluoroacetyl-CoA thioesterase
MVSPVMLDTGLEATVELVVADSDTAQAMGSGDVATLATPRMIALCEQATMSALDGHVDAGFTTVGLSVQVDHLRPTAVGGKIWAEAHLDKVEGRRLCFSVAAKDERGLIGAGRVTRVVVEVEHFMEKTR